MSTGVPFIISDRIAYMSTLSERLEELMKENPEFTQASIARACGIRQPSVSDWLSGRTKRMRGEVLLKAAEYLKVNNKWLATGEGPKKKTDITESHISNKNLIDVTGLSGTKVDALRGFFESIKDMREEDVPSAVIGFSATTRAIRDERKKKAREGKKDSEH